MNEDFESYLTARNHYRKYQESWEDPTIVDETENLPFGIYSSIIRYQPNHPDDIENDDLSNSNNQETWVDFEDLLEDIKQEEF